MVDYYDEQIKKLKSSFTELDLEGKSIVDKMNTTNLISMKKIGSAANNILTMKAAMAFVEMLKDNKIISICNIYKDILESVKHTNPNANGYDVSYDGSHGGEKFIAEVKCNIPVNADSFGAKQIEGITKDINNLFNGKESTKETKKIKDELGDYYKFFVVMTCESIEKLKCDNIRDCMKKIISPINKNRQGGQVLYYDTIHDKNNLPSDNVYVVFVTID